MKTVRLALYFVVGLLLGGCFTLSYAGTFQSYQGSAFRTINGTTYWKGDATSFAASKATVLESVKVGNTYITVPTMAQVTSGALAVFTAGVRTLPGMAGVATIAWLLEQGLQLKDGQWVKQSSGDAPLSGKYWYHQLSGRYACDTAADQCSYSAALADMEPLLCQPWMQNCQIEGATTAFYDVGYRVKFTYTYNGTNHTNESSVIYYGGNNPTVEYVPAGESDWDRVNGVTPPDQVMREMCQALAKYNATSPGCAMYDAKTEKAKSAMSDWAPNPTTGKDERQVAEWTPRPTPQDPFAGEVSVKTETKDASAPTDPATGDTTNPADTSSQDNTKDTPFCTLYPESLACAKMGTPEEADKLEEKTMGVESITIQTFGSSATCPAPIPLPHGSELSFEWPCRMAEGVKPFLLALAWLAAGLIVIGAMRND